MSAFEVGQVHIDTLLTAGLRLHSPGGCLRWFYPRLDRTDGPREYEAKKKSLTRGTAGRVGAMLAAENRRSVNYRYDEQDWELPYLFQEVARIPSPVAILKALNCYEYQSCEHTEWGESEASVFCEALRRQMIRFLPGYDTAEWVITNRLPSM